MISEKITMTPLVVDLDGSLLKTDLLVETASQFIIRNPSQIPRMLSWLAQGKCTLKAKLAERANIDVTCLPYNEALLRWLREQKKFGRTLVLATASHRLLASRVAEHLQIFDQVLATDEDINLAGEHKREVLEHLFGRGKFDYVGNSGVDLSIWKSAQAAHIVSRSRRLISRAQRAGNLDQIFDNERPSLIAALIKAMRLHQWVKNLLIFVPLFTAFHFVILQSSIHCLCAFIAFGLTASSVYLLNDLVDVSDDRLHASKKKRPFASGNLPLLVGWLAWPVLLALAVAFSLIVLPPRFSAALAVYFVLTLSYSLRLKRNMVIDVLILAGLYTMRIVAGTEAIAVPLSFWMLAFSMFMFLSLAFIKRYTELDAALKAQRNSPLRGRGYSPDDLAIVMNLGATSGYLAVLVLALYIQDSHTAILYHAPKLIWMACPILLYWISRIWFVAHRGKMHDDPIVFALKDRTSLTTGALFVLIFALARFLP